MLFCCGTLLSAQEQIIFFKYFRTDRDLIADNPLAATARIGQAHLEVAYNELKLPVLVTYYDELGLVNGYELYSYDNRRSLKHRAVLDSVKTVSGVTYYGDDEPWSTAFRDYAIPVDQNLSFRDQNSSFTFTTAGRLNTVVFRSVDGFVYGAVSFSYDHWNNLTDEIWRILPGQTVVRRYRFDHNYSTNAVTLSEFGKTGQLTSQITLEQAPADQLYKVPPPRTGNILDEVDLILDEISIKKTSLSYPAIIPRTEYDQMVLVTGEEMEIQLLEVAGAVVRFRQPGRYDDLSMPLERVQMIISRYGERVYP